MGTFGFTFHEIRAAHHEVLARHTRLPHAVFINDLLTAPKGRRAATEKGYVKASRRLDHAPKVLGIERHWTKGVWGRGSAELDHLEFYTWTITLLFTVTASNHIRLKKMIGKLLRQAGKEGGIVSAA